MADRKDEIFYHETNHMSTGKLGKVKNAYRDLFGDQREENIFFLYLLENRAPDLKEKFTRSSTNRQIFVLCFTRAFSPRRCPSSEIFYTLRLERD